VPLKPDKKEEDLFVIKYNLGYEQFLDKEESIQLVH